MQAVSFDEVFYSGALSVWMVQHSFVVYCLLLHDILLK
jgi:hypothetical protein